MDIIPWFESVGVFDVVVMTTAAASLFWCARMLRFVRNEIAESRKGRLI